MYLNNFMKGIIAASVFDILFWGWLITTCAIATLA